MTSRRELRIEIIGDADSAERALREAQQAVRRYEEQLDSLGLKSIETQTSTRSLGDSVGFLRDNWLAIAGTATAVVGGVVAVGAAVKSLAADAIEAELSQRRLEAVIRATGGAAQLTAAELGEHAAALQSSTGVSEEAILDFQSVLLTFRNIQGETFREATSLALDMAAVFGTDLSSAGIQLGKALNDPIEGLSALTRVGITFSDEQKALIEAMVATGDVAGAQGVILGELRNQVGGVAEELGQTTDGQLKRFNAAIGELKEQIGFAIVDGTSPLIEELITLAESEGAAETIQVLADVMSGAMIIGGELAGVIRGLNSQLSEFGGLSGLLAESAAYIPGLNSLVDSVGKLRALGADAREDAAIAGATRIAGLSDDEVGIGPAQTRASGGLTEGQLANQNTRVLLELQATQKEREAEQFLARARLDAASNNQAAARIAAIAKASGSSGGGGGGGGSSSGSRSSVLSEADELAKRMEEAFAITERRNLALVTKQLEEAEAAAVEAIKQRTEVEREAAEFERQTLERAQAAAAFAQNRGATNLASQRAIASMFGFRPPEESAGTTIVDVVVP